MMRLRFDLWMAFYGAAVGVLLWALGAHWIAIVLSVSAGVIVAEECYAAAVRRRDARIDEAIATVRRRARLYDVLGTYDRPHDPDKDVR